MENSMQGLYRIYSLVLIAALIFTAACGGSRTNQTNQNRTGGESAGSAEASASRPVEVSTIAAVVREIPAYLEATGSVTADESSDVAPQVSGQVSRTFVDVGAFVRQGQTIAQLNDRDARLRFRQAQTGVTQAQAAVRQAEARLGLGPNGRFDASAIPEARAARAALESSEAAARLAETNLRRYANLVETGDVARAVYDQARTQAETARAQVNSARQQYEAALNAARGNNQAIQSAEAGVEAARAQLAIAQKAVEDTVIRAPFSGYISDRPTAAGEYVTPASRIVTILRTNPVKLILQVPESESSRIREGLSVSANVAGYSDRQFAGRVVAINPAIDPTSRVLLIEAQMDNPENLLRPGMFATARILQPGGSRGVFVPASAVQTNQNTNSSSVYVIERAPQRPAAGRGGAGGGGQGENRQEGSAPQPQEDVEVARLRVVQRGEQEGDWVRIISGLNGDEMVVVGNTEGLFDGARIIRR
jgi:multidrug efflux pump subunit AcrA (membrane-fusion protein)